METSAIHGSIVAMLQRVRLKAPAPVSDRQVQVIAARLSAEFGRAFSIPRPEPTTLRPLLINAVAEFIQHKQAEGTRVKTHAAYRAILMRFADRTGNRLLAEISSSDLNAFLQRSRHPVTRRAAWIVLHRFFVWALAMGYRNENPLLHVERPRLIVPNAGIVYTPAEARAILCRTMHTDEIGYWALALFSGLRTEEIKRLHRHPAPWTLVRVKPGVIEVPPVLAKRRPRVIPILPVLRLWLAWVRRQDAPFLPPHDRAKLERTRKAALEPDRARLPAAARRNMARRSYINYRFGLPQSSYAVIAAAAGNTEPTIKKYYRRAVSAADAHEYFSLTPDKCASLRAASRT